LVLCPIFSFRSSNFQPERNSKLSLPEQLSKLFVQYLSLFELKNDNRDIGARNYYKNYNYLFAVRYRKEDSNKIVCTTVSNVRLSNNVE
jgi:hypothetical protein